MTLHTGLWNPITVQSFIKIPCTVFELRRLKLNSTTRRIENFNFCNISVVSCAILTKFWPHLHIDHTYHVVMSKVDLIETEAVMSIGHDGTGPAPSLYTKHYRA